MPDFKSIKTDKRHCFLLIKILARLKEYPRALCDEIQPSIFDSRPYQPPEKVLVGLA